MIRVLHIFNNMANGGVENFVMNYYRFIDREKIQFDFLTSVDTPGYFDEEIKQLGGKLYRAYPKKKNIFRNFLDIKKIVRENNYKIVHRHTGSSISNFDLIASKRGGAKTLISHSHAMEAGNKLMHYIAKVILPVECERFACSKTAARWLFGKKEAIIIPNAIDVTKYRFDEEKSKLLKNQYNACDKHIIAHIGSFVEPKNHDFIIKIFKKIREKDESAILWLIGNGKLQLKIKKQVRDLGLENDVLFWGNRSDIPDLLQVVDKFLFPSLKEGFGIVVLEAQCAGIPCYVSEEGVPKDIHITNLVQYISLKKSDDYWATKILDYKPEKMHQDIYRQIKEAGFDIRDAAKELEQRYIQYAE